MNLFGRDLDDPENMQLLAKLLAMPSQCVRALWLNSTNLTTLERVAEWLPSATSLRELYLLSNKEVSFITWLFASVLVGGFARHSCFF